MRQVMLDNANTIEYELTLKNVKNINVRVKSDGRVYVSANKGVKKEKIDAFIAEKSELILRAIEKYKKVGEALYNDGDKIKILGEDKTLRIENGARKISFDGDRVTITLPDCDNTDEKKSLIENLRTQICRQTIPQIVDRLYLYYFKARGVKYPTVKFRKMTSRWGSCHTTKGIITFSTSLASVDEDCIELVVAHELSHLICGDHSKDFYSLLGEVIPDHKQMKKALLSYSARL